MQDLIVGFSTTQKFSLTNWAIRHIYGTPFSHVYVKFYLAPYDRHIIFQASGFAVNLESPEIFGERERVVAEFQLQVSDDTFQKIIQFSIDSSGVPYGMKEALGLGYVKLMALFGCKRTNPFRDSKSSYVCSELVGQILKEFLGDSVDKDLDDTTPKDIWELVQQIPGALRLP